MPLNNEKWQIAIGWRPPPYPWPNEKKILLLDLPLFTYAMCAVFLYKTSENMEIFQHFSSDAGINSKYA